MSVLGDLFVSRFANRNLSGWVSSHLRNEPIILLYHGVTSMRVTGSLRNCEEKHTALDVFVTHLKALKRWRRVISMQEMVDSLHNGDSLKNAIVITFDDGYENNFSTAASVLTDFGMPSVFFIATGFIDAHRLIWTDQLELMLDHTELKFVQQPWDEVLRPLTSVAEKKATMVTMKSELKRMRHDICLRMVLRLAERLDVDLKGWMPEGDYRFMDWEQVRSLTRNGFEIGAHTINHPILSQISIDEAKHEIIGSRDHIVSELGICSSTFCYPNGKSRDYSPELAEFCRGYFQAAVSTNPGHADACELFDLRRLSVPTGSRRENLEWRILRA